jgi:hypothetical protein
MSVLSLTLTVTEVAAARGAPSTLTASVTNAATVPARVVLAAFGPQAGAGPAAGAAAWTVVDRPLRQLAPGATEQYTVTVTPPADAPAGDHVVRLIAYDADRPPEEYSDQAQQVRVTVPAAPVVTRPRVPWWIYAVAGVLVFVVAAVAFLLLRPRTPPPEPEPTTSPTTSNPCPTPFVPRLARPGDLTCVMPASAQEAAWDNREDVQRNRVQPGSTECAVPYVPRIAFPDDFVCVWEDTANRTHVENQPGYTEHMFNDSEYPETFTPRR